MFSCRICHTSLSEQEKTRGTCDKCEEALAKQILRKIVLNHCAEEKDKTQTPQI